MSATARLAPLGHSKKLCGCALATCQSGRCRMRPPCEETTRMRPLDLADEGAAEGHQRL